MNLILFILGVVGMTHIVVDSEISEPVHAWVEPRLPAVARAHGLLPVRRLLVRHRPGADAAELQPACRLCAGCTGSFLAQLGWLVLDSLERYAKGK